MNRRKIVSSEISSFDMNGVLNLGGIDGHLAHMVLSYLRSREQESFTFKAKTVVLFIESHGDAQTIYSPPTGRKIAGILEDFVERGLIKADSGKPKRYWGSRNRVDRFIRGLNRVNVK
jgi:hypothetical protein